jgi:hypothetical protein
MRSGRGDTTRGRALALGAKTPCGGCFLQGPGRKGLPHTGSLPRVAPEVDSAVMSGRRRRVSQTVLFLGVLAALLGSACGGETAPPAPPGPSGPRLVSGLSGGAVLGSNGTHLNYGAIASPFVSAGTPLQSNGTHLNVGGLVTAAR